VNSDLLQGFYLRDLLVDPPKGLVTGRAGSERLPPKAMEVLLCLASSAGELVKRETLIEDVWGTGHGSPEALSHAVSEIRHALDDHPDNPAFVQTLPKRGYRLIVEAVPKAAHTASVSPRTHDGVGVGDIGLFENLKRRGVLEAAVAYLIVGWLIIQVADIVFEQLLLPPWAGTFVTVLVIAGFPIALALSWYLEFRDGRAVLHELSPEDAKKRQFSRTYLSVIGAMAIAAILVFIYDRNIGLPEAQIPDVAQVSEEIVLPPILDNSIAVLPFLNIDGSDRTQIFASGFAEDVINRLARLPGLMVSSRGDSWSLSPNSTSQEVRRRLRVAYYLEGSVRLTDNVLRVVVQLIDSETSFHIVSRSFDKELEDFNQVQDDITKLTIANLQVALPPETQSLLAANYEEADLNAYVLYRRGKEIYDRPRTPDTITEIISFYEQALELDPQYAAAHAGLCNVYVAKYELSSSADDIERAEKACGFALASNPRLYMVYTALGELYRRTGRISEAEEAYDQALRINSQDAQAMRGLAAIYRRQLRFPEAEQLLHTAIGTQPGNWRVINSLGGFLFAMGRYDEAADAYRQVVFLDAENFQARTNLGSALTMAGDFDAGRIVFEEALDIQPSDTAYSNLGVIYYYLGKFEESVDAHRQAVEMKPGDPLNWLNLADALYFAGNEDESQEMFRRADELSANRLTVDPSDIEAIYVRAWSRQMLGDSETAREIVGRGLVIAPTNPFGFYYAALIETQIGDYTAAVDSLNAAIENGYPVAMLAAEPYLDELRSYSDFQSLVAEYD
jgi:tetratricopeptide (TPR) repeat protein/DNA-binding winged helix-turn-helix (wHTH) protein